MTNDKPPPPREPSAHERAAQHRVALMMAESTMAALVKAGDEVKRYKARKHDVDAKTAPLNDVAAAIKAKLELATCADNDADAKRQEAEDHRLQAALMLVELRRRVEGEDCDWWEWAADGMKFGRSRKDIERMLRMGGADDPEAAIEHERTETRERMRRLRGAHKEDVRSIPEPKAEPEPQEMSEVTADPVDALIAAFDALEGAIRDVDVGSDDNWRRVVEELSKYRIMRLAARLQKAIADDTPSAGVQSAADRAEARSMSKVH